MGTSLSILNLLLLLALPQAVRAQFTYTTNNGTLSALNGGTLNITDATHTQIKSATVSGVSRRNVVHTLDGGANPSSMTFNFSWTAPAAGTGPVTFYFAGVAADGDGNESNDYVYKSNQVFTEATCTTPAQPGSISGGATQCSGSAVTYSVATVSGATSYTWTLPSGWTGSSTSNSINVTSGSTSGNVTVTANNACGSSTAQTLAVTANTTPAQPGSGLGDDPRETFARRVGRGRRARQVAPRRPAGQLARDHANRLTHRGPHSFLPVRLPTKRATPTTWLLRRLAAHP